MGGMVDCGVTHDSKTSPRRAAIEKAQDELRYDQYNYSYSPLPVGMKMLFNVDSCWTDGSE
jgi:hypothetical protein